MHIEKGIREERGQYKEETGERERRRRGGGEKERETRKMSG